MVTQTFGLGSISDRAVVLEISSSHSQISGLFCNKLFLGHWNYQIYTWYAQVSCWNDIKDDAHFFPLAVPWNILEEKRSYKFIAVS